MKVLHVLVLLLSCMQLFIAEDDHQLLNNLTDHNEAENFRVSCEMDSVLELLMCGEDAVQLPDREMRNFIMIMGNSLSGKSTLTKYLNNIKLQSLVSVLETEEYVISEEFVNSEKFYSLTIFPELYIDKNKNTVFYDCPSFNNFKNFSSAIVSSQLLKNVMNLADRVKIVLTVSYSFVSSGENERDLHSLLTQTAHFINDITKFNNSIALMVTKVENRWLDALTIVEDFTVREEIEEFIIDFKSHWILDQVEDYPFQNKYMFEKVLNLTDILLSFYLSDEINMKAVNETIDEDEINKIGLFRSPDRGAFNLNDVPILKDRKYRVLSTAHEAIEYTKIKNGDFNYELGEDEIVEVYDVMDSFFELVTNKTHFIADFFRKFFDDGSKPFDLFLTRQFYSNAYIIFKNAYLDMYNLKNVSILPDILSNLSKELNVGILNEHFEDLKINIDFMIFLESMAPNYLYISASKWIEPFWSIYESLRWSYIWHIFLNVFHNKLINLINNETKHLYDVEDVEDWGKGSTRKGIEVTESNYIFFIEKLEEYNLERWDDVAYYKPDADKLSNLNTILNISLNEYNNIFCEKDILKFSGRFLSTSLVENYQNCSAKNVIFYASDKIIIDSNLNYPEEKMTVIMVAPQIIVQGHRIINLRGKAGEKVHGPVIDVYFLGEDGADGNAGSPGNASGHCVIITCKLNIMETLEIIVQGGKGWDGQRGGRGGIGISRYSGNNITYIESRNNMPDVQEFDACTVMNNGNGSATFKLMKCGTCGGSGGNGGKGGQSGPKGLVISAILELKGHPISIKNENRNGQDGIGGKRGENGETAEYMFIANFAVTDEEICGTAFPSSCPVCNSTADGNNGTANVQDSMSSDTPTPYPKIDDIFENFFKETGDAIDESKKKELRKKLDLYNKTSFI